MAVVLAWGGLVHYGLGLAGTNWYHVAQSNYVLFGLHGHRWPGLLHLYHGAMTRWVTGSGLDRVARCPGAAVLPRSAVVEGSAAAHGKRVHAKLERGEPLPGLDPELQARWYPPGGEHEIQAWYDPITRTAGLSREHKHRDYAWAPPSWIIGTLDYIHVSHPEANGWLADDLKTGLVLPGLDTLQLALGATALAAEFSGLGSVSLTHVPRQGTPGREYLPITALDLAEIEETFQTMYARYLLEGERMTIGPSAVTVVSGPHCRYCACKKGCPAWS